MRSQRQFNELAGRLLAPFTILPEGVAEHLEAARLRNICLGKGLNVSGVDCLIAACATVGHHELFAVDEDFEVAPACLTACHPRRSLTVFFPHPATGAHRGQTCRAVGSPSLPRASLSLGPSSRVLSPQPR